MAIAASRLRAPEEQVWEAVEIIALEGEADHLEAVLGISTGLSS